MRRLGPFEPAPILAVAVSGGADSMALALLARDWAAAQGGAAIALVVDHGLRAESAAEAAATIARLAQCGIAARLLALHGLARGPGLAARARLARHAALEAACAERGILHLLFGHHAGDQAETLRMRARAGSLPRGMAGMAALAEGEAVRRLRPLLAVPPGQLRALLRAHGIAWVEDPSNQDTATLRARLRLELDDPAGDGPQVTALLAEARCHGQARAAAEGATAAVLAARVALHPDGWAVLTGGPLAPAALSALICTIAGRRYPAATAAVAALARAPRAATLAGVRLLPAGRAGREGDWLVVREPAAMEGPVAAIPGALWDRRFRLSPAARMAGGMAGGMTLGALGDDAARLRRLAPHWPACVLRTLPALRRDGQLVAVPALGHPDAPRCADFGLQFRPALPLAGAPFLPI
ncbi:MAG: tRNA lysidine(34) synthetase TilS [Acetobacteraceae bacterium]|nr:tRNA lysidine(34) synthetase TilS [Acetobacteraceae bacterium]